MTHRGNIAVAAFNPTNKHQEEAVRRLALSGRNNYVHSLNDGSAEVLVEIGGAYRAYLVGSDGSATLTMDGQPTDRYRLASRFIYVGLISFVGLIVVGLALYRDSTPAPLGYATWGGFGVMLVGVALASRQAKPPVQVKGWHSIRSDH